MALRQRTYLTEAAFKWRWPTKAELKSEFETEWDIQNLYDAGNLYPGQWDENLALFLKTLKKVSGVRGIRKLPKALDIYDRGQGQGNFKRLSRITAHMGKDVVSLRKAMMKGQALPYPLFLHDKGKLVILGGRTRVSTAKILGLPINAIVISKAKVEDILIALRRKKFLEGGYGSLSFTSDEYRVKVLAWLDGGEKGELPLPNEDEDFLSADEAGVEIADMKKRYGKGSFWRRQIGKYMAPKLRKRKRS